MCALRLKIVFIMLLRSVLKLNMFCNDKDTGSWFIKIRYSNNNVKRLFNVSFADLFITQFVK